VPNEPSSRNIVIFFVVVALAIAGGAAVLVTSRPEPVEIVINPPPPTGTPSPSSTPAPLLVYVTGAVANPEQTIDLPAGSRVQDAIDAAGGFTEEADLTGVNVAGILRDGDQIHVPEISEESSTVLATPSGGDIVRVNTATVEELQALPGIGPALAQRIIDYRDENGVFTSFDDLDQVSGVGPALLENITDLIAFD
jgi:competence protein ComEA